MAHYLCCTRYCGEREIDDQTQEIRGDVKAVKNPIAVPVTQKALAVNDDSTSVNNSVLRASFQNLRKDLIHDSAYNPQAMENSKSNSRFKAKGKSAKDKVSNAGMNKSSLQISMTNNKTGLILGNTANEDIRILRENKIVKRSNRKDYNIDAVYGKPSNVFLMSKQVQSPPNQDNSLKRTFKKLHRQNHSQSQGKTQGFNICEICREMYKKMIINKEEFQPLRCPNCGNVLNESVYNYYLKLFSFSLSFKTTNRYLDEGRMTGEWTKWIQLQTNLKKENLAYDIVKGNAQINTHNEKDEQLKRMISTTKSKLRRANKSPK